MYAGGVARCAGGDVRYVVGGGAEEGGFGGLCASALLRNLRGEGAAEAGRWEGCGRCGRGGFAGRHVGLVRHVVVVGHGVLPRQALVARHVGIVGHVKLTGGGRSGTLRTVSFVRVGGVAGVGGRTQETFGARPREVPFVAEGSERILLVSSPKALVAPSPTGERSAFLRLCP